MKRTIKSRKLLNRTGKRPCQICNKPNILQAHHIMGRKIPNYNHASNIADVCPTCHNELHWGELIIEKWVMTSSGMQLIWHKKGENGFTGEDSTPHQIKQ